MWCSTVLFVQFFTALILCWFLLLLFLFLIYTPSMLNKRLLAAAISLFWDEVGVLSELISRNVCWSIIGELMPFELLLQHLPLSWKQCQGLFSGFHTMFSRIDLLKWWVLRTAKCRVWNFHLSRPCSILSETGALRDSKPFKCIRQAYIGIIGATSYGEGASSVFFWTEGASYGISHIMAIQYLFCLI